MHIISLKEQFTNENMTGNSAIISMIRISVITYAINNLKDSWKSMPKYGECLNYFYQRTI